MLSLQYNIKTIRLVKGNLSVKDYVCLKLCISNTPTKPPGYQRHAVTTDNTLVTPWRHFKIFRVKERKSIGCMNKPDYMTSRDCCSCFLF